MLTTQLLLAQTVGMSAVYPSLMHLLCVRGKQVLNLHDPLRKKREKGNFFMQRVLPRHYTDEQIGAL